MLFFGSGPDFLFKFILGLLETYCILIQIFFLFLVLQAHPANCICIEFDPTGKYFAVGSADALVSLWDVNELACVRTFSYLEWPVRTISFSHDGKLIAMASVSSHCDLTKKKCLQIDFRCGVQTVFRRKFLASKTRQKVTRRRLSYFEWPVRTISFSHNGKLIAMVSDLITHLERT